MADSFEASPSAQQPPRGHHELRLQSDVQVRARLRQFALEAQALTDLLADYQRVAHIPPKRGVEVVKSPDLPKRYYTGAFA